MKKSLLSALLLLAFSFTGFSQTAFAGDWVGESKMPDGQVVKFKMSISQDGYEVDMGMKGKVDVVGKHVTEGNRVTVWDVSGEFACPSDQKGVYTYALDGDTLTFTKVSDPCEGRGSDDVLVLKRM